MLGIPFLGRVGSISFISNMSSLLSFKFFHTVPSYFLYNLTFTTVKTFINVTIMLDPLSSFNKLFDEYIHLKLKTATMETEEVTMTPFLQIRKLLGIKNYIKPYRLIDSCDYSSV